MISTTAIVTLAIVSIVIAGIYSSSSGSGCGSGCGGVGSSRCIRNAAPFSRYAAIMHK
jgi:hypothetical protein